MDVKLGFGSIPKPQYVFVSKQHDYCWYMLAEDERRIPIYDKALTGIITGIELNKKVENTFGWFFGYFYGKLIVKFQFNKLRNLKLLKLRKPYPSLLINLSLLLIPSTVPLVVLPSK